MSTHSIDIIIPSFRLQSEYLRAITQMDVPENTAVRYLIIADNPKLEVPRDILSLVDNKKVVLLKNKVNLGASKTRNVGIDHSTAEWVLFLDDDVKPRKEMLQTYVDAINKAPEEIGFFGETAFPEPKNSFTNGLVLGGMMYFFSFARYFDETICATTSNVIVKRSAIGNIRFRNDFPKKGGGEDFTFFLEIYEQTQTTLKSVKDAQVYHNWWNNGKRNYRQFIRWSYAEPVMFKMFPKLTYIDFPNVIESLFFGLLIGLGAILFGHTPALLLSLIGGIIAGEIFVTFTNLLYTKGAHGARYTMEIVLVWAAAHLGRLAGIMSRGCFQYFLTRINCSTTEVNIYFRLLSGIKFFGYLFFTALIWMILQWL